MASVSTPAHIFVTGETLTAANLNANPNQFVAAINNIDNGNIGAGGIFVSQLKPTSVAQATFSSSGLTFVVANGLKATSGNISVDAGGIVVAGGTLVNGVISVVNGGLYTATSTSTGIVGFGGIVSNASLDYGVQSAGRFTLNAPLDVTSAPNFSDGGTMSTNSPGAGAFIAVGTKGSSPTFRRVIAMGNAVSGGVVSIGYGSGADSVATVLGNALEIEALGSSPAALFTMSTLGNIGVAGGVFTGATASVFGAAISSTGANSGIFATSAAAASLPGSIAAGDMVAQRSTSIGIVWCGGSATNYGFDGGATSAGNISWLKNGAAIGTFNGTTGVYVPSDARLKENVAPLTGGLDLVKQLKARTFDWVETKEPGVGFIAQEVQTLLPQAVLVMEDATGKLGFSSEAIIPYLVEAVQQIAAYMEAHP